jgi:long-subunit fatty acid transport protein
MKSSISKSLLVILFLISSISVFAQNETTTDTITKKEKKLKFGCGFGLNFVGGTSLNLSPNLTYKVSEKVSIGGGLQGSYNAIKNLQNTTTFGANILGFYNPIKKLQTTLEFAQLRVKTTNESTGTDVTKTFWDSALFAGAGYNVTQKISIGAKYNFLYKEDESVYSSPVIPYVNVTF